MRERLVAKLADAMRTHLAQGGLVPAHTLVRRPLRQGAGGGETTGGRGRQTEPDGSPELICPRASIWDTHHFPEATRGWAEGWGSWHVSNTRAVPGPWLSGDRLSG